MFSFHFDLGQVIIASMLAIIGWFIKKEITIMGTRLDKHDDMFLKLVGDVQRLIGMYDRRRDGDK